MKIKFFTKNKNNKIEFTEEELKKILDEIYNEGYSEGRLHPYTYTYTTPYKWDWNNIYCNSTGDYISNARSLRTTISASETPIDKNTVKWTKGEDK